MNRSRWRGPLALFAVAMLLMSSCSSRGDDSSDDGGDGGDGGNGDVESSIDIDDCETDPTAEIEGDTIKLVSSYPQSELVGAFAEIARGWAAYFDKVNEEGGVEIAGKSYPLAAGDALLFEARLPHCWQNRSQEPATFLLVFQSEIARDSAEQHLVP